MHDEQQRNPAHLDIPELDEVVIPRPEGSAARPPHARPVGQAPEPGEHVEALRAALLGELLASLDELTRSAAEHALKAAAPVIFERLRSELRAHLVRRLNELAATPPEKGATPP